MRHINSIKSIGLIVFLLVFDLVGCAPSSGGTGRSGGDFTPDQVDQYPAPTTSPRPKSEALLWERGDPQRGLWSNFVFALFRQEVRHVLTEVQDMEIFCPRYPSLSEDQKINVWGMLVSSIVKFESQFNPAERVLEPGMGTDVITKLPVYSEGLMQLSYQDITRWRFCRFDWERDRYLHSTDPRRTILDPYTNLECGVRILADQITRKKRIILSSQAYWSVLNAGSAYHKISQIAADVKSLSFCR